MRILVHGINFAPELTGVGKYTGEFASWLAEQGEQVRVVTAPPYYPAWRIADGYRAFAYRRERMAGVDVWRTPLWVPARPRGLTRALHLLSFALSSLPVMLLQVFWRPHVVIVLEPTFASVAQAWLVARLSGGRAWLHVQDFELDAAVNLGMLPAPARRVLAGIESWLMRRFDRVSTITASMLARLGEKGVDEDRIRYFPNWIDTATMRADDGAVRAFRSTLGVAPWSKLVLYAGNFGEKQGLDDVLHAAALARTRLPDTVFILCGEGVAKARLMATAERQGLENVRFLPLQPADKLPLLLRCADVHLVTQARAAADLVMPSKLLAIYTVGGAAIVTADPGTELYRLVHDQGTGLAVEPESPDALLQAVEQLAGDDLLREGLGRTASNHIERHLTRDAVLGEFFRHLRLLADLPAPEPSSEIV